MVGCPIHQRLVYVFRSVDLHPIKCTRVCVCSQCECRQRLRAWQCMWVSFDGLRVCMCVCAPVIGVAQRADAACVYQCGQVSVCEGVRRCISVRMWARVCQCLPAYASVSICVGGLGVRWHSARVCPPVTNVSLSVRACGCIHLCQTI